MRQVGGMVQPGQSAIFVLGQPRNRERIAEQFRGFGGTIPYNTPPPRMAERVQRVIALEGRMIR